ncbi:MAG: hypothetical protein V4637_17180, partial [Pseudomonadota bacterium]
RRHSMRRSPVSWLAFGLELGEASPHHEYAMNVRAALILLCAQRKTIKSLIVSRVAGIKMN